MKKLLFTILVCSLQFINFSQCNPNYTWAEEVGNSAQINFTAPVNSPNTDFTWDFGDGTAGNGQNPSNVYSASGNYWVCLNVSNQINGCNMTYCDSITVYIAPLITCDASFSWSFNPNNYYQIDFVYNGGSAPTANYSWTFGDGTSSSDVNPNHIYAGEGNYTVCLTVVDTAADGSTCSDMYCSNVPIISCNANFSWIVNTGNSNQIDFTYTGGNTSGTEIFNWTFDDGTSSSDINPNHIYSAPGDYLVCLAITDTSKLVGSCTDTVCKTITITGSGSNGLNETSEINTVSVYPNPFKNDISVSISSSVKTVISLKLTTITGKVILSKKSVILQGTNIIDLKNINISEGMYFLEIIEEKHNNKRTIKIIKS